MSRNRAKAKILLRCSKKIFIQDLLFDSKKTNTKNMKFPNLAVAWFRIGTARPVSLCSLDFLRSESRLAVHRHDSFTVDQ